MNGRSISLQRFPGPSSRHKKFPQCQPENKPESCHLRNNDVHLIIQHCCRSVLCHAVVLCSVRTLRSESITLCSPAHLHRRVCVCASLCAEVKSSFIIKLVVVILLRCICVSSPHGRHRRNNGGIICLRVNIFVIVTLFFLCPGLVISA